MIEEYLRDNLTRLNQELVTASVVNGKDISDIIRGRIMMLQDILSLPVVFENFDRFEKQVKDAEKGVVQ